MKVQHKYFVVEFLEKPYSTIDSKVCVPFRWIKLAKKTNNIVSVAYPAEYSPSTREMVRNICTQRDEWRYYKVKVKCGKQSFTAAERYIKSRNNTESEKTECSNPQINENKSASKKNTRNSNNSSLTSPVTNKYYTENPILRKNRSEPIKLSIKQSMPDISAKDLFQKRTKTVKTSELMSEIPNHSNESGKNFNENKLVSLDLDCLNQERHDYIHPTIIKQMQLAQRSNEMHGMDLSGQPLIDSINTPAQNSTDQSCGLSDQSHQHQSSAKYIDSLHHNLQSQNQLEPSSAKIKILEEKIIVPSYSKAANPSLELSNTSHNNQIFKENKPVLYYDQHQRKISIERSMNAYDNDQQMCPNITTITSASALCRLRGIIAQNLHLPSDAHNEQLLTIKEKDIYQKPRTQEIFHRSAGVNPVNQSTHPQSATHQEPYIQETFDRSSKVNSLSQNVDPQSITHQEARAQIVIDKSTKVNPIEHSDSSQSTTRKVLNTSERNKHIPIKVIPTSVNGKIPPCYKKNFRFRVKKPRRFPKLLYEEGFSPVHETGNPSKLNHTEKSIYFENNTENKSFSIQSTPSTNQLIKKSSKKNLSLTYKQYMQEQFSPISEDSSYQEIPTEEVTVEKTTENNHIKTTTCPEINTKQESKVPNLSPSVHTLPEIKPIVEECLLKIFQKIVEQMQLPITDEFPVNCNYNNPSGKFNEAIKQMLRTIDRYFKVLKNNIAESVSQEPVAKPEEKPANNKNKKSNNVEFNYFVDDDDDDEDDDDDDDDDDDRHDSIDNDSGVDNKSKGDTNENDDENYEPPKKKRGSKRSFVLPPEYDAHNSRWTLKYQAIEPGVVELTPHSKIYINSLKLANCKRIAKDYKTFGRLLLVEIFSQNALSVCSLTGAKANAFDVHESDIRPGLDKEARSILLTYVENYGRKQGWGPFDTHSVVNSLRSKIQEMRSKYGSMV